LLDRPGQVVVGARLGVAHVLAEAQHHAELVGLHEVDARADPEYEGEDGDQEGAAAAEPAAGHDRAQLVLTAAQNLLEVRRGRTRGLRTRAPRPLGTGAPRPAALIIPGHDTFSWVAAKSRPAPGSPSGHGL